VQPVEVGVRVDDRPVAGVRDLLALRALDDLADRQVERRRERVVALVVAGHGHDRAGARTP
jgi:hypothetical protein